MKKPKMYATCDDSTGTFLEEGEEYRVLRLAKYKKFGDRLFYILEDGLAYADCHFSVTYLK